MTHRLCLALLLNDSTSNVSKNLNLISQDLGCTRELGCSSPGCFKQLLNIYEPPLYNGQDRLIIGNIKDLIYIRDAKCTRFTESEINFMLHHLCKE